MATYYQQQHQQQQNDGKSSDMIPDEESDGGLQTLILMNNPNLIGYAPHPYQRVNAPQQHYMPEERESPRAQQGLSLTLASRAAPIASAYLKAAHELLQEVVNVSVDRVKPHSANTVNPNGESPPAADSLTPIDKHELQMKKAKLITLLHEVEQRQRQYQQQMQAVLGSFEQRGGTANSATTYTCLALNTISNQFRSLRGAISGQIRATNKSLGEEEEEQGSSSSSRLKMLDLQFRQQRLNAWRPQRGLPEKAVSLLRAWLFHHFLHPYPKDSDKIVLAKQTGLTRSQVSNWFINARVRLWKPMIEEMYAEEVKEHQQQNGSDDNKSSTEDQNAAGEDQEKDVAENHSSSIMGSTVSIPTYKANTENPFVLVDDSEAQGNCLKKQRMMNNAFLDSELFNNGCKEEGNRNKQEDFSMMQASNPGFINGLVSYPIGEIGRFVDGQFPSNFSGNGVSLTLGLPHCEGLSMQQGNNQAFLSNNQDMDEYRGRLEMNQLNSFGGVKPPNSSQNAYAAHLLHDFVA